MLYTLYLHSAVCQLYLNKTDKNYILKLLFFTGLQNYSLIKAIGLNNLI